MPQWPQQLAPPGQQSSEPPWNRPPQRVTGKASGSDKQQQAAAPSSKGKGNGKPGGKAKAPAAKAEEEWHQNAWALRQQDWHLPLRTLNALSDAIAKQTEQITATVFVEDEEELDELNGLYSLAQSRLKLVRVRLLNTD